MTGPLVVATQYLLLPTGAHLCCSLLPYNWLAIVTKRMTVIRILMNIVINIGRRRSGIMGVGDGGGRGDGIEGGGGGQGTRWGVWGSL